MEKNQIICPFCNKSYDSISIEPLKEWTRGIDIVKRVKCPYCGEVYRIYSGTKKNGEEYTYTMKTV
jgi:phage FluMu protein Com